MRLRGADTFVMRPHMAPMMKVGVLGTGDVGKALATGFAAKGHDVMMGSRSADHAGMKEWVNATGPNARGGSFAEAAAYGEMVVLATKGAVNEEVIKAAQPTNLAGKVLIDATNPLTSAANAPPGLAISGNDSGGEQVQRLAPEARVVKCFNIVGNPYMVDPDLPGGPPTMLIAGNDAAAKDSVKEILGSFGWNDVYDLGGIEGSRYLEAMCMAWVGIWMARGSGDHAFKVIHK